MLRLFSVALSLFLSLQLASADPPSTDSFLRHAKASSPEKQSLISTLLLPRGKFNARAADACPSGYQSCANYPGVCAPNGYYCCSDLYTCPNGENCCIESGGCCELGYFCCTDSSGGCCPNGSSCILNSNYCTYSSGGGGGGGDSGGSGGGTTTTTSSIVQPGTTTSVTSIVQPGTTSAVITFNGPTTLASSSSSSTRPGTSTILSTSTVSAVTSTTSGLGLPLTTGAAAPGIVLTPGRQLAALVAVVGVPILHNFAHVL